MWFVHCIMYLACFVAGLLTGAWLVAGKDELPEGYNDEED